MPSDGCIQSGKDTAIIIGILLVFTLTFSGALSSLLTRAQRHEILASAAAYVMPKVPFLIP